MGWRFVFLSVCRLTVVRTWWLQTLRSCVPHFGSCYAVRNVCLGDPPPSTRQPFLFFQFASFWRWHTHGWTRSRHMEAKIAQETAAQTHRDAALLSLREIPHQLRNAEAKISVSINFAPTVNGEITAGERTVNQTSLACRWEFQCGCQYLFVMLCCNS